MQKHTVLIITFLMVLSSFGAMIIYAPGAQASEASEINGITITTANGPTAIQETEYYTADGQNKVGEPNIISIDHIGISVQVNQSACEAIFDQPVGAFDPSGMTYSSFFIGFTLEWNKSAIGETHYWPTDSDQYFVMSSGWTNDSGIWSLNETVGDLGNGIDYIHFMNSNFDGQFNLELTMVYGYYSGYLHTTTLDSWNVSLTVNHASYPNTIVSVGVYEPSSVNDVLLQTLDDTDNTIDGLIINQEISKFHVVWEINSTLATSIDDVRSNTRLYITITYESGALIYAQFALPNAQITDIVSYYIATSTTHSDDGEELSLDGNYTITVNLQHKMNASLANSWTTITTFTGYIEVGNPGGSFLSGSGTLMSWAFGLCGVLGLLFTPVAATWRYKHGDSSINVIAFMLMGMILFGMLVWVFLL